MKVSFDMTVYSHKIAIKRISWYEILKLSNFKFSVIKWTITSVSVWDLNLCPFATKNFLKLKKNTLLVSFVAKKKIGNAVKRNRIRRKLKAITQKILKIRGAINTNYTYIIIFN